jgi:hypothetical protein
MNWSADRVEKIVQDLQKEFRDAVTPGTVEFLPRVRVDDVTAHPDQVEVNWSPSRPGPIVVNQRTFDAVLVAVGFGLEEDAERSYWSNDNLEHNQADGGRSKWIVSGLGDGALIDVLRPRLGRGGENIADFTD